MKQKAIIFGIGETADRSRFYLENDSNYHVHAFTVECAYIDRESHGGLPVIDFAHVEDTFPPSEYAMLLAVSYIGLNRPRARIYAEAKAKGYRLITYLSSRAITWPDTVIGDGTRIYEGTVMQAGVKIGSNVVIAAGVVVSHNTEVKDHCFISSGVTMAGKIVIEPYCFVGAGAVIRDNVHVASGCVIGAGVVLLKSTRENEVYRANDAPLFPKPSGSLKKI